MCDEKLTADIIYKVLTEDIARIKREVWTLVYYHLLFQAAMISFIANISHSSLQITISLIAVVVSIFITKVGWDILDEYYKDMLTYRKSKDKLYSGKITYPSKYEGKDKLYKRLFHSVMIISLVGVILKFVDLL